MDKRIRMLASILVSFPFVLLLGAPRFAVARAGGAAELLNVPPPLADLSATDLLVFGVLGLAAASAAIAVRMVRRSH